MGRQINDNNDRASSAAEIAERAYASIAAGFPVCAQSDEFYFFPQVVPEEKDWQS